MVTIQSPPTHVEVEKVLMHFTLYLRHSSLPGRVCTVQFVINETKLLNCVLYPEFYDSFD